MRWSSCRACGHVFTEGYFTDSTLQVLFERTSNNQVTGQNLERSRLVSARMIEKILPYQATGPWLDVGFGNGSLLITAQEFGFSPFGLDLRVANVKKMLELKIPAEAKDITHLEGAERFAVISMADVLEHIPYPPAALGAAHRLLKPKGALFISMPNSESILWDQTSASRTNPYWSEIEHYHNFSRTRLFALLAQTGFTAVSYGISERYRLCMEVVAIRN